MDTTERKIDNGVQRGIEYLSNKKKEEKKFSMGKIETTCKVKD